MEQRPHDLEMAMDWEFRDGVLRKGTPFWLMERIPLPGGRTVLLRCRDAEGGERILEESLVRAVSPDSPGT